MTIIRSSQRALEVPFGRIQPAKHPTSKSHRRCHRLWGMERLEVRAMLSASPINGRPYFELGPSDNVAWDQPRVTVEFGNSLGQSIGPSYTNQWLLDTGANTILAFQSTINDMNAAGQKYFTDGFFEELGVGGSSLYDLSLPYRMDFAGSSGERSTLLDTRIISDATRDISLFGPYGIVGMPAMTERVTKFDFSSFTSPDLLMKMDFASDVPSYAGPRYTIKVDNRFEYFPEPHVIPAGHPTPAWADIPFLTAQLKQNDSVSTGNFLFDTGAQVSIINKRIAFELGLDTNGDGLLDNKDASFARDETIGGIGGSTTVPVFLIDQVHVPTEQGVDLVWTDLQWLVLDIDPGIDAVFGFDNMTSGWIEAFSAWAASGSMTATSSGYIKQAHLDFRGYEASGKGTIYLDFNPEIHGVVDPNQPGAVVVENGDITSVSETGIKDTYSLRLTQPPTANVTVTLSGPLDQQATAVDANNLSNHFLTFTPQNWDIPQIVQVSAVNDTVTENFHRTYVRHTSTSADSRYQGVGMPRVVVNITDDDFPGVMLIPTDGATRVTEGGGTDTYQVVLTKAPSQNVTITMGNIQQQVTAKALVGGTSQLTFTPQNWNVPQTVVVTAVDDQLTEGSHKSFITHSLSTSDQDYQQAFLLQENVQITDNDGADTTPPRVQRVIVGSSQWSAGFIDAIDGGGVGAGNGLGLELNATSGAVQWENIDRIYVQFSENVNNLTTAAIDLKDSAGQVPRTVNYNATQFMATISLGSGVSFAKLGLAVADSVTDTSGNRLDGDTSGAAGGVFSFRIDILAADGNRDGRVTAADLAGFSLAFNRQAGAVGYDAAYDWNGDGRITAGDLAVFSALFNRQLAALSNPGAPFSTVAASFLSSRSTPSRSAKSADSDQAVDSYYSELDAEFDLAPRSARKSRR